MIPTADANKRYYWLKLKDDFFRQKEIKQLRKIAGGEVFIIIYLKMLLRSLKDDGKLYYEGIEENFPAELALDIDEDVENTKMTVSYLQAKGILIQSSVDEYELLTAGELTGSEGYSAERMRRLRGKKLLASHSDAPVTASDEEKREKSKEQETRDKSKEECKRFTKPTLEELQAYAKEKTWTAQEFDAEAFRDFYESKGWRVGDNPMKDWKAACRNWVRRYREKHPAQSPRSYDAPDDESIFW